MFVELMRLLRGRTVMITVARLNQNLIPRQLSPRWLGRVEYPDGWQTDITELQDCTRTGLLSREGAAGFAGL